MQRGSNLAIRGGPRFLVASLSSHAHPSVSADDNETAHGITSEAERCRLFMWRLGVRWRTMDSEQPRCQSVLVIGDKVFPGSFGMRVVLAHAHVKTHSTVERVTTVIALAGHNWESWLGV